jgi:tetratricopeptide (TPR) repeat protein
MNRAARVVGLTLAVSGCAYYNAMWSAERFAREARRLEARGQEPEARTQWARAAVKAESVLVHHPQSRWADDAVVLRAEGLARAGTCAAAAAPIAKALATVSETSLRERAGLAAAQCALTTGKPVEAEHALTDALASNDAPRRSRAEFLAGQGAADRLDYDAAVAHFRRSREPAALPARARALLAAGRPVDAAAVLDTVAEGRFREDEWAELLGGLAAAGGVGPASLTLDRMLARSRVPFAARARLLIADGDRRSAAGDLDGAGARYRQAAAAVPGSAGTTAEAGTARVREQRALAGAAARPADLSPIIAELTRIVRPGKPGGGGGAGLAAPGGAGAGEAQRLLELVARVAATSTTPGEAFRSAELARDSLGAPRLAGQLFLELAANDPGSLFAPKALVAALPLVPERHDSILGVLGGTYAASPYTRALRGEASLAYGAAEDSLARELGVELARGPTAAALRPSALRTGPRGPWLEDPPVRVAPPPPGRGRERPTEPGRRVPTERPVVPAAAS